MIVWHVNSQAEVSRQQMVHFKPKSIDNCNNLFLTRTDFTPLLLRFFFIPLIPETLCASTDQCILLGIIYTLRMFLTNIQPLNSTKKLRAKPSVSPLFLSVSFCFSTKRSVSCLMTIFFLPMPSQNPYFPRGKGRLREKYFWERT